MTDKRARSLSPREGDRSLPSGGKPEAKKAKTKDFASGQGFKPKEKGKEVAQQENPEGSSTNPQQETDTTEELRLNKVSGNEYTVAINNINKKIMRLRKAGNSDEEIATLKGCKINFQSFRQSIIDGTREGYNRLQEIVANSDIDTEKSVAEYLIWKMTSRE